MNKKILIIQRRPGIGDMCLFYPCINEICKAFQNFQIILLASKRSKSVQILNDYEDISLILNYERFRGIVGFFKLLHLIKSNNFDKVIIFHYGIRYYLAAKLGGAKNFFFYGFKKKNNNIVEQSRELTKKIIAKKKLKFLPVLDHLMDKQVKKQKKIVFGIGGSGNDKKWKISNFIELAKKIYNKKKVTFIIAGGKNELKDFVLMKKNLKDCKLISLCQLSIEESLKYLKNSNFYIGNDTGFMHLCGGINVKAFGLFGNTPVNYGSYNKNIIPIIPENLDTISHGSNAMNDICVEHVFNKIKKLI